MSQTSPVDVTDRAALSAAIKDEARRLGFDLVGIAPAVTPTSIHEFLDWLDGGYAGAMHYLERRREAYEHPEHVLPNVRSVVMLGLNYKTADPPPAPASHGRISRYAWGDKDYHDLIRGKLRQLAQFVHAQRPDCRTRGVVDTAPLLERDFARLAGLGWFGKNTLLINKAAGSLLFLAGLLLDVEVAYDSPHEAAHCGTCTRCLEACPTDAFAEPYVLDARRCISYLTIELRNAPIPAELREPMGQWLFGCDVCQDVCPWNRKTPATNEPTFQPRRGLAPVDAAELLELNENEFRERFGKTPLARPGRTGILRNAAIVLGNAGDQRAVPALIRALDDPEPLIRGAAAWALGRLGGDAARAALEIRKEVEDDAEVLAEIQQAIGIG